MMCVYTIRQVFNTLKRRISCRYGFRIKNESFSPHGNYIGCTLSSYRQLFRFKACLGGNGLRGMSENQKNQVGLYRY